MLDRLPGRLSGGESSVALPSSPADRPELLLLDEPLASLDIPRKRELLPCCCAGDFIITDALRQPLLDEIPQHFWPIACWCWRPV